MKALIVNAVRVNASGAEAIPRWARSLGSMVLLALVTACATTTQSPAPQRTQAELDALKKVRFEDTPQGARAILDESVLFVKGKSDFVGAADSVLDVLKPVFTKVKGQIIVEGHTDKDGTAKLNEVLSKDRANRLRAELIKRQVPPDRVVARGLSFTKQRRDPEVTEEDKQINRRGEFFFPGETAASLGAAEVEKQVSELDAVKDIVNANLKKAADFVGGLLRGSNNTNPPKTDR